MADRLLVLGWHNAESTPFFPSEPGACARGLTRQLGTLRRIANVVPLETALAALAEGRPLPPRAVALTFDDGYRDNLETAIPILRRLGLPATFYLVPGLLDRTVRPWWELLAWAFAGATGDAVEWRGTRLPTGPGPDARTSMLGVGEELKGMDAGRRDGEIDGLIDALRPRGSADEVRELFLDWDGARRLASVAAIGSHTMCHAILSRESADAQMDDLRRSREVLERGLEVRVATLAYPNGTARDYDAATLAAAEAAGYRGAVTTIDGWNDRATPALELRRFVMDPVRGRNGLRGVVRAPGSLSFARGR
jgi:peptidoglycan/xylan/chitin deacetylase (PgdA/CDA1 family)